MERTDSMKIRFFFSLAVMLVLILASLPLYAAAEVLPQNPASEEHKAQSYTVRPASSEIKIDGILDEPAWADAMQGDLPFEWRPGDNVPSPVESEFLVTFSSNYLYIAMRCYDPEPEKIRAHIMDRDAMDKFIQDDHVSLIIDPFNDERRGFQFRINPLGVQADANFSELEGYEDFSWDAIWASAGKITEWGWAFEIAIPFNQLRFPSGEGVQTWGFSAERSYPRNVRHRMTSHRRDRGLSCILCQMNKITGFQGMKTGLNLEIAPTLTASRTDVRPDFPDGPFEKDNDNLDPGLTVRWGITPNLIFNATANPDFSQVEADVAQLDVNTRFALRFPEKRPFFLEGADFFLTPIEAVFTRTVADPAGGLKFTGKVGKNAFGVFGAFDKINNLLFPANKSSGSGSFDQDVPSGVFRYRRDVGRGSTIGALYTGRAGDEYFNHTGGFDGFFRLSRTKTLNVQYLHSETRYGDEMADSYGQDRGRFGGDALDASFLHMGRDWIYTFSFRNLSPGFRADYGYVPRVDLRRGGASINRLIWGKPGSWFSQISVGLNGFLIYDLAGKLTDSSMELQTHYTGPLQTQAVFSLSRNREFYLGKDYNLNQGLIFAEMKPMGGLRLNFMGMYGGAVDYANAREARQLMLAPVLEFNLGRHISINFQDNFQELRREGKKIFNANLLQGRFVYNFNVRSFVRLILQYLDLSRDPAMYGFPVEKKTQTLFTQLLFSYKLNPQTVLFLGYSDNYLGRLDVDLTQLDRTFFVKLGYAWTR
jgi:hypothetical protein